MTPKTPRSPRTPLLLLLLAALPTACDDPRELDEAPLATESAPRSSSAPIPTLTAVAAGDGTTCALTLAGRVECWGRNDAGQLALGHTHAIGDDETPAASPFIDLGGQALEIHTNGEQTLALLSDGRVRAWGRNDAGQLALGHTQTLGDDETLASANVRTDLLLGAPMAQLALGDDFACARSQTGTIHCWGANDFGQLGLGTTEFIGGDEPLSELTVELDAPAVDVTAGAHHACALLDDGLVRCWGLGGDGQLGLGTTEILGDDESPLDADPVEIGGTVVDLVAGGAHTCALLDTGAVRCWGANDSGQLGLGTTEALGDDESPASGGYVSMHEVAVSLAAGWDHTCAVLDDGTLRCWGANDSGQLGLGHSLTVGDDELPEIAGVVPLGERRAKAVFSGPLSRSTCVLLDGDRLRCWGDNDAGQLGLGHTAPLGDEPLERGGDLPDLVLIGDDDDS